MCQHYMKRQAFVESSSLLDVALQHRGVLLQSVRFGKLRIQKILQRVYG